ncbi:hypothetical protein HFC70_13290 [Agrobacterium sp. a22-2]|nr:hypothetical protein [Agrobacterium sp. a22-2]
MTPSVTKPLNIIVRDNPLAGFPQERRAISLSRWRCRYPEVKIEIISDAAVIDIVEQGFDAGVRFGKQLAQDMIALPLGPPLRYAIVASPDYIKKHGQPQTQHDLVGHDCIKRRFPGGTLVTWRFTDGNEEMEISPTGRLTVSAAHSELQAALAGRGIAHVIDDYAKPHTLQSCRAFWATPILCLAAMLRPDICPVDPVVHRWKRPIRITEQTPERPIGEPDLTIL